MRGAAGILAAALLVAAPLEPAWAQQPSPIPDWPQTRLEQRDPSTMSLYILATCLASRSRGAVEALLATPRKSTEERQRLAELMPSSTECPIRTTRLTIRNTDLVRGAVAEAIYNHARTRPRTASPLPLDEAPDTGHTDRETVAARVARCAVHRAPLLAHSVVSFAAGSERERRALVDLRPTFVSCLPQGQALAVSRLFIRTLIAEELYQASRRLRGSFENV